ncbi:MAG: glycosyltransferase family 4 protein [Ignavibacteriales bacterium]|nr:glycosyltransferase family 4 protein [Ignavibacteriales bacterium]
MKVLIDDGLSSMKQLTGIGQVAVNLHKHLQSYCSSTIANYSFLSPFPRKMRRLLYLPLANRFSIYQNYDVVHFLNFYVPFVRIPAKKVVTIHDLCMFRFPETLPNWYLHYSINSVKIGIKRADRIIVVSNAIREDLLELFPEAERKTEVCYNGIRDIFFSTKTEEQTLAQFQLDSYSYFLFVGVLQTRKGIDILLNAFIQAKRTKKISSETKLVIVGKKGYGFNKVEHLISYENAIIRFPFLSDEQIVALMKFAKAFVFPSRYEGFGMPIIESMTQQTPIIASDIPPTLELDNLHNRNIFLFESENVNDLVEKISYVEMNQKSIRQNLEYGDMAIHSFDAVALDHYNVYQKVCGA